MTSGIASKNVDLDSIFDPWLSGTSKARATGIAKGAAPGTDLNALYAPLIYGSSAAATGIQSQEADLNTLFAAKGTAKYALPIDGQTFTSIDAAPAGGASTAHLNFQIGTSGWTVVATSAHGSPSTDASGPVPSGATSIQITDTWLNSPGDTNAGTTINTCTSYTTIPSTGTVGCEITEGSSATTGQTTHRLVITMKNAGGTVISTTTTTFVCETSTG